MSPKKIIIITIPFIAILMAVFFIPTNELLGIGSNNEESPSPMMVLENTDDILIGLKITPVSCNETSSGLTESSFQITNTHEIDYKVRIGVSFTDNDRILYEKQEIVDVFSGQTISQIHLSDAIYDNPICVVQIIDWDEI